MSGGPAVRTVSVNEAASLAGVARRTIYNWLHAGRLEWTRTAGGAIRIEPTSLFRPGSVQVPDTGPAEDVFTVELTPPAAASLYCVLAAAVEPLDADMAALLEQLRHGLALKTERDGR